ncbi:FAD-binding and (Fe-S)-binding domain-containing protein [Larsenimonas rhizosphaerae]|uniref:D-lactate dehydrogenase (cytochrome) n=1 Tax=Larsenimonas rhizosphaerae TaxID=2944682 RepID=A0AA41ZHD0_9GAMM|nr:FAD-binding and (Fe-S)-binding domain-containing protein [Larsenimonas rhizosphaerae]MCX2523893.1 FAD-binding and (Fe-S)-binding domain-containing protein [Larsenimonas rhizosphaerae]
MAHAVDAVIEALSGVIDSSRLITDPLRRLAYGTDASFYRLIPQLVVRVDNERELQAVLAACTTHEVSVTFRAAGTSLSGQAITDSVLIQLGRAWQQHRILDDGRAITLQPGVIGARANQLLLPFQRKIGPDPASIDSCMIGGIAANNASGMCCGTANNTYQTVQDMRMVLADGTVLDTADSASVADFRRRHGPLLARLEALGERTRANTALADRIRHKYRLKNTMGYSLNSLVDFSDGISILKHLMVGSEGTLGFISSITYRTIVDEPLKAAALAFFPDMATTCRATLALKSTAVSAVELMDRAALRSVEDQPGLPESLKRLPEGAAALLVDVRGNDEVELDKRLGDAMAALEGLPTCEPIEFTRDVSTYSMYWKIRKGMFPAVGAVRDKGTTVVIEDVAFPIEHLEEGVRQLTDVFARHGYQDAILFGHALEGNLHFVFPQGFERAGEIERYEALMEDVVQLVGERYDGSLKAEHGTGRNMAPFVEREWGADAYQLMWEIKALLDPRNLLNPDVILTRKATLHLENLKPLPAADNLIDHCIECGFCEPVCPSRHLTLTPRQRIVVRREMARLEQEGRHEERNALDKGWQYDGLDTCAADGMCQTRCPVGINTGDLIRAWRHEQHGADQRLSAPLSRHFGAATRMARWGLGAVNGVHRLIGTPRMSRLAFKARHLSHEQLPLWTPAMPRPAETTLPSASSGRMRRVVYLPSCATRMFGPAEGQQELSVMALTLKVLERAGMEVIVPEPFNQLCCGMAFQSKGHLDEANAKADEVNKALLVATENGRWPVVCDTSPCVSRMNERLDGKLSLFEPVAFIHAHVLDYLSIEPVDESIALHVTCSSRRMGLTDTFKAVAQACAREVVMPAGMECCGFAGDKGFQVPELNASALEGLEQAVAGCKRGYSNSRTCEIGLSQHSGIPYYSILSLVERASRKGARKPVSN